MQEKKKNIQVGKFYYLHDGSITGHPCFVIWKNDEKNRYLVIRFDSDKKGENSKISRGIRHITKLSKTIGPGITTSYVRNRPMFCKRKDFGYEMKDLSISEKDFDIIQKISEKPFEKSPSLSKKK